MIEHVNKVDLYIRYHLYITGGLFAQINNNEIITHYILRNVG